MYLKLVVTIFLQLLAIDANLLPERPIVFTRIVFPTSRPIFSTRRIFSTRLIFPTAPPAPNYAKCSHPGYERWITVDNKICYYISSWASRVSWHDASNICGTLGGKLPSIHSMADNNLLVGLTRSYYTKLYNNTLSADIQHWIGLNSLAKRGFYKWSDGTPIQYRNLAINPPPGLPKIKTEDPLLRGRCVYLSNSIVNNTNYGFWYFGNCNDVHSYVCEKDFSLSTAIPPTTQSPPGNCPSDWLQYADEKCIKIIDSLMTFTQAKARCNSIGGELLTIHSSEEQNYITSLLPNKTMPFIGFYRPFTYSAWSWDDESEVTFTNWAMLLSVNYNYKCVVVVTNEVQSGKWMKVSCNSTHTAICEKPKDTAITVAHSKTFPDCTIPGFGTNGLKFVQYRNSCYLMVDSSDGKKTWNDAETACQQMNGAHLVSIVDPFEYAFLMYYLKQYAKSDQFWIGFYEQGFSEVNVTQVFKWTDNWPIYFTKWDDNEPQFAGETDKECVFQMRKNGTWRTADCLANRSFICKTTINPIPKMNKDGSGICPQLNSKNKNLKWVDLDKRSQYCYWFSSALPYGQGLASWADAAFQCNLRNGTLASIHSSHDLSLIKNQISINRYNTWIGLYQTAFGDFVWQDKSAVDFTNWDENLSQLVKDEDYFVPTVTTYGDKCVEIKSTDLKWIGSRCSSNSGYKFYICQIPKIYKTSTLSTKIGLSSGSQAGIIIGVILLVAILCGVGIFTAKKFKLNVPSFPSFENSLYSSRRGPNVRLNGTPEPVATWSRSEKESPSPTPKN